MGEREKRVSPEDLAAMASLKHWGARPEEVQAKLTTRDAIVDCGWGRLIFGQTFADLKDLANSLREETEGQRDVAFYVRDPHVVLSSAPQELFLDPSHTSRLSCTSGAPGQCRRNQHNLPISRDGHAPRWLPR